MSEMKPKPRIVVLAGAGASKAVSSSHFPTTVEFFERLPDSVQADKYFQFVLSYVQNLRNESAIDIEIILWEMQKLLNFYSQINEEPSIIKNAVHGNLIASVNQGWNSGQLADGSRLLFDSIQNSLGLINEQVYDLYGRDPEPEELSDNWELLISKLIDNDFHTDIFTTNYDLVIENAFQNLYGNDLMFKYSGASGRVQRFINLNQWQEDSNRKLGLLTKLHGSLNWKKSGDKIAIGDSVFTGSHSKHAIIYPGFKGQSNAAFFEPFHSYFSRSISLADHFVVIGFAFRDEYLNQIIRSSLSSKAKITIIDTNDSIKFPDGRSGDLLYSGFGRKSVNHFIDSIEMELD